jgi:hypothetical protein
MRRKHFWKESQIIERTTNRREYKILRTVDQDPYSDEGWHYYPRYRKGFKNPHKEILPYQVRMYKTWKHNRKQQWKN